MTKSYTLGNDLRDKLIGKEIIGEGSFKSVFVPLDIAKDLVELLDNQDINYFEQKGILNKHFLDIYCTSGSLLWQIVEKLLNSKQYDKEFRATGNVNKLKYILENNIFAVCPDLMTNLITCRELFGNALVEAPNIEYISQSGRNSAKPPSVMEIYKRLKEIQKLGGQNTVKFDVVVGNPPYNDGMDIDFVFTGYNLARDFILMITPAKWQTADGSQKISSSKTYRDFRKSIVPHMKAVTFYPDCKDVFNIMQSDGITYYLIDKNNIIDKCEVVNICKNVSQFNSVEIRDIKNRETLINVGNSINKLLADYKKFTFPPVSYGLRYVVCTNSQLPGGGLYAITKSNNKVYYLGASSTYDTSEKLWNIGLSSQMRITFSSDNKLECDSFASYLNTRFVRFFIALNISKMSGTSSNDYFRFVPMIPGKLDHIYTDEELYKTFNIPQEYIDIIEGVVKERKIDKM